MAQDPQRELQDLATVHTFYLGLLEKGLGHRVLTPAEVKNSGETPEDSAQLVENLKLWLDLLDFAITPPSLRDALRATSGFETAHALLRYFVRKKSLRSGDRDKTDCVITHLFRNPPQADPALWQRPEVDSSYYFISQAALAFEGELYRVLGDVEYDSMNPEQVHLLQEFEYFYQELEEFRHFDQIMDSGMVQRVREMKQSLSKAVYHPDSLAHLAAWNDVFGRKFDELFHDAAKQIKTFAENVQREGGSILARVEGDITVKQLSELAPEELMAEDYEYAQDEFRKVSKFKKAVDSKRPVRIATPAPPRAVQSQPAPEPPPAPRPLIPTGPNAGPPLAAVTPPPPAPRPQPSAPLKVQAEVLAVPPSQAVQNAVQEGKIHSAREAIKEHVRTSDSRVAAVVPIKKTRITLSPAEIEAFKADYQGEKSFRADYAAIMMTIVAYLSRMIVEVDEYNQKAGSAYLWKPHADALGYLLTTLERLSMEAEQIMAIARARGLADKAAALGASLDKLRDYGKTVSQTLQAADQQPK